MNKTNELDDKMFTFPNQGMMHRPRMIPQRLQTAKGLLRFQQGLPAIAYRSFASRLVQLDGSRRPQDTIFVFIPLPLSNQFRPNST